MQIHCYTPKGMEIRVYVMSDGDPRAIGQDAIWDRIKRHHYAIQEGNETLCFDDAAEEAEERAGFFVSWDDDSCWQAMGPIAIDDAY